MLPAGHDVLAHWREAGEWWRYEPQREFVQYVDIRGNRRESETLLPPIAIPEVEGQVAMSDKHSEDWVLRERKIRDEKVSAACGHLPETYYHRLQAERDKPGEPVRTRTMLNRPDLRPTPTILSRAAAEPYVALHAFTGYAFGRSAMLAEEIPHFAAQCGCPAVAIGDPFSLVGAVEFHRACQRNGVRALIGSAFELPEGGEIVLIARSKRGYISLSRLISECHLEEPRQYPLSTWERLERHAGELICLTGGGFGPLDRLLMRRDTERAARLLERLRDLYGQRNLFVQIERSYMPWQASVERQLLDLAESMRLTPVAGGPMTHARRDHFPAQDILVCANSLCTVDEIVGRKERRHESQPQISRPPERALNGERFIRTAAEMQELFADRPDLLANTHRVAEGVDDDVLPSRTRLPQLYADDNAALRQIVAAEAPRLYGQITPKIRKRLDWEVERICRLGFAGHFLVAHDFCRWAGEQGIQLSGRGSVIDSAVSYVLGFSRIDAIRHHLHFDRFLPGDGTKRPDIDIDFEARRRDDVRNYIIAKYGVERVGQVCAIGAYCTRGIVREVGKALGLPPETIGFLAKRIHGGVPPDQIVSALERKPELRASGIPAERFRWVFRLAQRLMDVPRDIRCHSSGVVISQDPIADTVPVMWSASEAIGENLRLIQWDKRSAKYYFDKFDILCLRGQDVLSGTERRMKARDPGFDVSRQPIDDEETFRAFRSGELIGIPQSASPAMRQAHIRLQTQDLTDASLVQAGIRPGVGGAVKINELIARRRGKPYSFEHPKLAEILDHTYGIIVFQEQVDQLLQTFCGYSGGQAEDIRDAIHKRRREDFGVQIREQILAKVRENGFGEAVAERVFDLVSGFKGYGFAQGHALAFAEVSIRSVYCQQNYPAEYFASLLSAQPAGYYGPCTILNEARTRGVAALPVCVNRSQIEFSVEDVMSAMDPMLVLPNGGIRVGLMQVSGLSGELRDRIVSHRADGYLSIFDFARRVRPERDELEALILCGAFDSLHSNRRALLWAVPAAMDYAVPPDAHPALPFLMPEPALDTSVPDFSPAERSVLERRVLDLDVANHLMAYERDRVSAKGAITTAEARHLPGGRRAIVVGNPIRLRFPPTPSGKRVVFFDLEDETGLLNVTAFDATYQRDGHAIVCSPYVTIIGQSQDRDGHIAFLAERVFPYRPSLLRDREIQLPITTADFLVG